MSYLRTFDSWADGVKQTFNPDATSAGFNVGAHTADPSALVNGDVWYQSTVNELRARINGVTVALGASGASPPFTDSNALVAGSGDPTKLMRFEIDGFTTATTRVLTPPNADITLAGINISQVFSVTQTFSPAANTSAIISSGQSLTGANDRPLLDLSTTWNTTGSPTGIKFNVTNIASGVATRLLDIQLNSGPALTLDILGNLTNDPINPDWQISADGSAFFAFNTAAIVISAAGLLQWGAGGSSTLEPNGSLLVNSGTSLSVDATTTIVSLGAGVVLTDGANTLLAFFNATPVAKQVVAPLTNNVSAAGTNDVIDDFGTDSGQASTGTDLMDQSTIPDKATLDVILASVQADIYQLARKLKEVSDSLITYGLIGP